jgi:transcriptional regulator with GAF, ATPase, and Fis domain
MSKRFNLLADPRFSGLQTTLQDRVRAAADSLDAETFPDVFDSVMRGVLLTGLRDAQAHEGTLWLVDSAEEHLVPAINTGPNAASFVGKFKQPLSRGLISMVFATEQPFCENEIYARQAQDKTLDRSLGVLTCSMIAVPLYFAQQLRGVISCVQLKPVDAPEDPPRFSGESLRHIQLAAEIISRLLDHRFVGITVGWQAE